MQDAGAAADSAMKVAQRRDGSGARAYAVAQCACAGEVQAVRVERPYAFLSRRQFSISAPASQAEALLRAPPRRVHACRHTPREQWRARVRRGDVARRTACEHLRVLFYASTRCYVTAVRYPFSRHLFDPLSRYDVYYTAESFFLPRASATAQRTRPYGTASCHCSAYIYMIQLLCFATALLPLFVFCFRRSECLHSHKALRYTEHI